MESRRLGAYCDKKRMKWVVPTELNFGVKTTLFTGLKSGAIKQNRSYGTEATSSYDKKLCKTRFMETAPTLYTEPEP
jgi:hypothetical protein